LHLKYFTEGRPVMEKVTLNAAIQRAQAREDFAHSAENRLRGPERELTHAERDDGGEFRQKRARSAVLLVDAHRDRYAAAVAIQAAVMSKAAHALIALHEELHDDVRQDAGNDYGKWHPVGFGGDGLGNGPRLDAVVALGVRIAADAVEALRRSLTKYQHHHEDDDEGDDDEAADEAAEAAENGRVKSNDDNDSEAERRSWRASRRRRMMIMMSRAPGCPAFKVMDEELPRALADG
jgi:hypothetical protein